MPDDANPTGMPQAGNFAVVRRLAIWTVFAGALYLLRSFFLFIFITFVFSYSAEKAVQYLTGRFSRVSRQAWVAFVFIGSIAVFAGLGFVLVPSVKAEIAHVKAMLPSYRDQFTEEYRKFELEYPAIAQSLSDAVLSAGSLKEQFLSDHGESRPANAGHEDFALMTNELLKTASGVVSGVLTVLIGWLFAFLITLDLKNLHGELEKLKSSRVGWVYQEVRSSVIEFAASVGWFLEAQILISAINTVLTVAGLWILGVPSILLLSVIIFFTGLVPVLGALLPVIPLALIAMANGGLPLVLKVVIFLIVERIVVAYWIEPRIFGRRFQFNSVFVLVILLVGYKVAGIWGVILGLPVAYTMLRPRSPLVVAPASPAAT